MRSFFVKITQHVLYKNVIRIKEIKCNGIISLSNTCKADIRRRFTLYCELINKSHGNSYPGARLVLKKDGSAYPGHRMRWTH